MMDDGGIRNVPTSSAVVITRSGKLTIASCLTSGFSSTNPTRDYSVFRSIPITTPDVLVSLPVILAISVMWLVLLPVSKED
jgi:hypothetical protein